MKLEQYKNELSELSKLEKQVEKSLSNAPAGRIRAEMSKGKYPQYYYVDDEGNNPKGKYLKKDSIELARACVQKEYDRKVLDAISRRKKELKALENLKKLPSIQSVYTKLSSAKKSLVSPYVLGDSDYITEWFNKTKPIKNTIPMTSCFTTERGEEVRSKSEKMIADKLFIKGIPYKYEAAIELKGFGMVFPDFTLLNINTREEVYLEHFGMMDNPEYCKKALEKIDLYEQNGIFLGERLFATFESSMKPINLKSIEHLIEKCKSQCE